MSLLSAIINFKIHFFPIFKIFLLFWWVWAKFILYFLINLYYQVRFEDGNIKADLIQKEMQEFHERVKRKSSVILREFVGKNQRKIQVLVDKMCQALGINKVLLQGISALKTEGMFRAQIEDTDSRRILLQNTRNLRQTEKYRNMYINRDLTYNQRQQLKAMREVVVGEGAARGGNNNQAVGGLSGPLSSELSVG